MDFIGDGPIEGWILRIASNLCFDTLKKKNRREKIQPSFICQDEEDSDSVMMNLSDPRIPLPENDYFIREERKVLETAIEELPPEKRDLFSLIYFRKMNLKEAATVLWIPYGTAKSRWYYGVRVLGSLLKSYME